MKLFNRDFTMVVIGQIISLFGNTILRYALPIYLLNETHSAALFGAVSACSFLPMIFFAPIGGIVADRINKRNIMVILDFSTAGIIILLLILLGRLSLVPLLICVLMLLYGIQGAYGPAVQASIPALQAPENFNSANAIINMVSSLAGIMGPVIGGVVFAAFGLTPILYIGIICFIFSAVMEIFIHIPFEKRKSEKSVLTMAKNDISESVSFIKTERPIIARVSVLLAIFNMIFSALMIVGLPVIVTEMLGFPKETGNRLYGYAEGALALGGLLGGLYAGIRGKKLSIRKSWRLIFACTLLILPILAAVLLKDNATLSYALILIGCFTMMTASTIFSVEMISYVQFITPHDKTGKVMALLTCLVMCASPLGQAVYGYLFEKMAGTLYLLFAAAFALCLVLTAVSKKIIGGMDVSDEITEEAA